MLRAARRCEHDERDAIADDELESATSGAWKTRKRTTSRGRRRRHDACRSGSRASDDRRRRRARRARATPPAAGQRARASARRRRLDVAAVDPARAPAPSRDAAGLSRSSRARRRPRSAPATSRLSGPARAASDRNAGTRRRRAGVVKPVEGRPRGKDADAADELGRDAEPTRARRSRGARSQIRRPRKRTKTSAPIEGEHRQQTSGSVEVRGPVEALGEQEEHERRERARELERHERVDRAPRSRARGSGTKPASSTVAPISQDVHGRSSRPRWRTSAWTSAVPRRRRPGRTYVRAELGDVDDQARGRRAAVVAARRLGPRLRVTNVPRRAPRRRGSARRAQQQDPEVDGDLERARPPSSRAAGAIRKRAFGSPRRPRRAPRRGSPRTGAADSSSPALVPTSSSQKPKSVAAPTGRRPARDRASSSPRGLFLGRKRPETRSYPVCGRRRSRARARARARSCRGRAAASRCPRGRAGPRAARAAPRSAVRRGSQPSSVRARVVSSSGTPSPMSSQPGGVGWRRSFHVTDAAPRATPRGTGSLRAPSARASSSGSSTGLGGDVERAARVGRRARAGRRGRRPASAPPGSEAAGCPARPGSGRGAAAAWGGAARRTGAGCPPRPRA